jgi:hypothetical protein
MSKKKKRTKVDWEPRRGWGWVEPRKQKLTIDGMRTAEECDVYVSWVFAAVLKLHGENEARRIFAQYANGPTKRETKLEKDAALLLRYLDLFLDVEGKPNVRRFARQQAKDSGTDPDTMERKVWRVLKDQSVWANLGREGYLHCPWPLKFSLEGPKEFLRLWRLLPPKR